MKVLFVAPVDKGSGETITCLHAAEALEGAGHEVFFLASAYARRFLAPRFGAQIRPLGAGRRENQSAWSDALDEVRPDAVVFADYYFFHLFPQGGVAPLCDAAWEEGLEEVDAVLVTFDHFGFGRGGVRMFFGPPHLSAVGHETPVIPERMRILLPCPMHEPGPVAGRKGRPFRYWPVPFEVSEGAMRRSRERHLGDGDGLLIFHSVSRAAWGAVAAHGLSFYRHLAELLDHYLAGLPAPVTVVSVNSGSLLRPRPGATVRFVNLEALPSAEFEALLLGSDLSITENGVSISMGKAVCGYQVCAAFRNSWSFRELMDRLEDGPVRRIVLRMEQERWGTVFPFTAYPAGLTRELDQLALYRDNSLTRAFESLEIFDGEETRPALHAVLTDPERREGLRARQREYVGRLRELEDCSAVLERIVREERGGIQV